MVVFGDDGDNVFFGDGGDNVFLVMMVPIFFGGDGHQYLNCFDLSGMEKVE